MSLVQRSTVDAVRLVTVREVQARLRSRAFVVSAVILLVMVVAGIVVAGIVGTSTANATTPVAVVSGVSVPGSDGLDVTTTSDRAAAEQLVRDGEVDAAIVPDGGQLGFRVVGLDSAPTDVVQALSVSPEVDLLDPGALPASLVAGGGGCEYQIQRMHEIAGQPFRYAHRVREMSTMFGMIQRGEGVSIVPTLGRVMLPADLVMVPTLPRLERTLVLTGPSSRPWHPLASALVAAV